MFNFRVDFTVLSFVSCNICWWVVGPIQSAQANVRLFVCMIDGWLLSCAGRGFGFKVTCASGNSELDSARLHNVHYRCTVIEI